LYHSYTSTKEVEIASYRIHTQTNNHDILDVIDIKMLCKMLTNYSLGRDLFKQCMII